MDEKYLVQEGSDKPAKISLEDRQAIEVLYLKIENYKLQQRILQSDLVKATEAIQKHQQELIEKSKEFQNKYGIMLGRDQIAPDGTIVKTGKEQS